MTLARKSVFIIVADIFNAILSYIALYVIARYMNPGAYGLITFATGYVALMTLYGDLGFDSAHTKYVSAGENQAQCTSVYLLVEIALIFLDIAVVLFSLFIWTSVLGKGFESPDSILVIYIILISSMIRSLAIPFLGVYTAKREVVKYKFVILSGTVARLTGIVLVAVMQLSIFMFASVYIAETLAILATAVYFFFRSHTLTRPTRLHFKMYASFAFPMAIVGILSVAISNFSIVLIQLCFGSADVGYYSAALRMVSMLGLFTGALGTLLFPVLSHLHANGNAKGISQLISESERYIGMVIFPLAFCTIVLSAPIAFVMLAGWMPAAIILQILPLYLLFNALEQPYSGHILGSNNPKFIRDKMLVMFCINIGLNILLVPKQLLGTRLLGLGGAGSAIALVISAFSGWLYCRIISHRILSGINIDRHLLLHFISAAAMALIVCYLVHMFSIVHWYSLIAVAFVYLIGYISLLIVFKEFTRRDLYLILNAVNPQKLYEYTKEEIKR